MTQTNAAPVLIFDLGAVLIDWNPRYLYRKLFADEAAMEHFLATVCTPQWNAQQDAGRSLQEATDELLAAFPEHAELITAFYGRWPEMIAGEIAPTVEILRRLKDDGYRLAALSNWSAETFAWVRQRFEFFDWFDTLVISGEVKLAKPQPEIFALLLARLKRRAQECIFIDDSSANVEAAAALGFRVIHYRDAEQLHTALCSALSQF